MSFLMGGHWVMRPERQGMGDRKGVGTTGVNEGGFNKTTVC